MSAIASGKKRSLKELEEQTEHREEEKIEPVRKKAKLVEKDVEEKKVDEHAAVTVESIQKLFAVNTSTLANRLEVYQHFQQLSLALMRDLVLVIPIKSGGNASKKKLFQFVEFEFYCLDSAHHQDVFAHAHHLQFTTSCSWYFHRSGNSAAHAFKYMSTPQADGGEESSGKQWVDPRPNVAFRGGTFKGMDITFGAERKLFGGILIRSLRELSPTMFDANTLTASGEVIEGPCKCVDRILAETNCGDLKQFTASSKFSASIFGNDSHWMYVDLATNYNIQSSSSSSASPLFFNSPRVGLTLKAEKGNNGLSATQMKRFETLKREFVMAPYRSIRTSCLSKLKRYKPLIALSLLYNDYYQKRVNASHGYHEYGDIEKAHWKWAERFGPFPKKAKLNELKKQCEIGQKDSSQIIEAAVKKWKTTGNDLAQLFGALMVKQK